MLNALMMNAVRLNAVMLSVVAPLLYIEMRGTVPNPFSGEWFLCQTGPSVVKPVRP
jgi:hypothetical protein